MKKSRNSLLAVGLTAILLASAVLAFMPGSLFVRAQSEGVQSDITYCTAGGIALKMDLYAPRAAEIKLPAVAMYVHGGGWTSGDKSWISPWVDELTSRGYLVAAVNYRLAPTYRWPAQIQDVKCAVRYLRANAATYKLDPNRIGVFGESAGGHLVALMGLTDPSAGFEGTGGYADQSSRVQAVIDMYGPTDFTAYDPANVVSVQVVQILLGATPDKVAEGIRRASPVTYVSKDAPPFLILQGDKDETVPLSQSQELYDRLTSAGAPAKLVVVTNAGHGFEPVGGAISPSLPEIHKIMGDFFDQNLRSVTARSFAETGKTVRDPFLSYWDSHGGLAQQGFPISPEIQEKSETDGKVYIVQYFERSVFEMHSENTPPNNVLLSLLGNFRYKQKYPNGAPNQKPNTSSGSVLFPQTGKHLGGKFLTYWQKNGGLAQQGYPISDEFTEKSDLDGKTYLVQYFERAIFEYHPENPPPYDVLLSQLGTFRYKVQGGR